MNISERVGRAGPRGRTTVGDVMAITVGLSRPARPQPEVRATRPGRQSRGPRCAAPPPGTVVDMIEVLMNAVAVTGGVVLFLMLLSMAALPLLEGWGEQL